ncbi:Eukaryotic translation initiation factor 5 [Ceratocystis lukuohia]|uniref:Eukaryotic translation initiation factor 5 n=2 Tax=Ceratocystis TaxID=5157 RepID=A0A0F8D3U7_CERFI|nr:Eukaryotic translation initiation factor 5 [Ceratocystis platani]
MANINVNPDITDQFYRYKMPRLQTKIEGKGNGIKTVVVNLSAVAQSLARPGSHLIKYFGFELGAQTNIDPPDDRWIINGSHDTKKLQDHVYGFIVKFVLCKKCKNPETVVIIKDDHIILDCKACGQRTDVDLRLKLSSFILKNQPKKGKKDKAERKAARRAKQQQAATGKDNGGSGAEEASENGSNEADGADDDGDASDQEFQKMKSTVNAATEDVEVKDDEWAVDMSEEAVKARQAQLPTEFKAKMTLGDDDDEDGEGGGNTIYDEFGQWVIDQAEAKSSIDDVNSVDIYVKAKEMGIEKKHRTVLVLAQTIFNENIVAQIPKRTSMLKQLIGESEKHMKALLGGTERMIGSKSKEDPEIISNTVVKVLQLYYLKDLISEEVVTKWGTKASKKYIDLPTSKKVRKAAEPFLAWLEEAEEESDSDDEE